MRFLLSDPNLARVGWLGILSPLIQLFAVEKLLRLNLFVFLRPAAVDERGGKVSPHLSLIVYAFLVALNQQEDLDKIKIPKLIYGESGVYCRL